MTTTQVPQEAATPDNTEDRVDDITHVNEELHTQFVQMEQLKQEVRRLNALTRDLLAMYGEMSLGGQPKGRVEVKRIKGQSNIEGMLAFALTQGWEIISFNQYMEGPQDKKALTYDIWLKRFVEEDQPKPEPTEPTPPPSIPPKDERPGWKNVTRDEGVETSNTGMTIIAPEDQPKTVAGIIFEPDEIKAERRSRPAAPTYTQYYTDEERQIISDIRRKAQMREHLESERIVGGDDPIISYVLSEEKIG